jgi:uncharacterized membrane protein
MHKLALFPLAALLAGSLTARAASNCDPVIAAALKVLHVPAHLYMAETTGFNGGKTRNAETVYLNGTMYTSLNGVWRKSPMTLQELGDARKDSAKDVGACSMVHDELVCVEPATLYKVHKQTPDDTVDTQIWISKLRGLPLKQINDIDVGGGPRGKSRTEVRYEYTGVSAPAVAETTHK